MANAGNWIQESTNTTGTGAITLIASTDASLVRFRDAVPAGLVWYTIFNGDNREAGQASFDGINQLTRIIVNVTLENGVYTRTGATPLNLVGSSVVSCTFNTATFEELENSAIVAAIDVTFDDTIVGSGADNVQDVIDAHLSAIANPHGVTPIQIGLGNVDNTSDANKPISTAGQTGLDAKENDLLNPTVNGQVLTSTTGGVRSWATQSSGVTDHALLSNIGTNTHAQIDTHITDTATNLDLKYDKTGGPLTGNLTIDVAAPILKLKSSFSGDGNNWDSFVDINNGNYILKSRDGVNSTVFDYVFSPAGSMTANRVFATNEVPLVGSELTTKNYVEGVLVTNADNPLTTKIVTNFDTISTSGFYKAIDATGTPIASEVQLIDLHWDAVGKSQIAMSNNTGNIYTRVSLGGTLRPWKQLTDTDYVTSTTLDLAGTRSMTGDLTLNSPSPAIYLQNLNAPTGSQGWGIDSSSGGDFRIVTTSDTGTFETTPFTLSRSGEASFTGDLTLRSTSPAVYMQNLNAATTKKGWGLEVTSEGDFRIVTTSDTGTPEEAPFFLDRNGNLTLGNDASESVMFLRGSPTGIKFRDGADAASNEITNVSSGVNAGLVFSIRSVAGGGITSSVRIDSNGNILIFQLAPTDIAHATRKDYVDGKNRIVTTDFSGGIYNLVVTDEGNSTKSTGTTSQTFNFVADIGMPIGAQGIIVRGNSGPLFMQAGSGITLLSKGGLFNVDAQEGVVTWYHESSNVYRIMGDLA